MDKFNLGDVVTWRSQARGSFRRKKGVVVHIVPPKHMPFPYPKHYGGGDCRDHESYVVDCNESANRKPNTYWPRVSALTKVSD